MALFCTSSTLPFLLLLFLQVQWSASLASPPAMSVSPPPPIKRVAVIGTGIAGLSLAHALANSPELRKQSKSEIEVSLFDSRPSLDFLAGAGVQINGGMSVLRKINPTVQRAVADAALPLKRIRSRTKPWFDKGEPFDTLFEMGLEDAIRKAGGKTEDELIVDGEVMCYTIMRGALQEVLMETLPRETAKRVQFSKTLIGIRASDGGGITCEFDDGSSVGDFDMVVGCDGVKTAVKEYIETGNISSDLKREGRSAIYSGIRIRYAVQDGDASEMEETSELRQYFGDGAWSLAGIYGAGAGRPPKKASATCFLDSDYIGPFKKKEAARSDIVPENVNWSQDVFAPADTRTAVLQQLDECAVPTVDVGPIVANADRFFELGVYFHNPVSLSGWSKEVPGSGGRFCTLSGDAAHAMPPFLGQGANQAIQDGYCLAKKIFDHNAEEQISSVRSDEDNKDIKSLLKDYERQRWAATTSISVKSFLLGYLETGGEGFISKFRDVFFFTLGKIGVARKVYLSAATPDV